MVDALMLIQIEAFQANILENTRWILTALTQF